MGIYYAHIQTPYKGCEQYVLQIGTTTNNNNKRDCNQKMGGWKRKGRERG